MSNHYTYRVRWSEEDEEFVATVLEFSSLSWLAGDPSAALDGLMKLVDSVVADMLNNEEKPPVAIADRHYSGNINLRGSSDLHRQLTLEAMEQGVSINQWALRKLGA